MIVLRMLAACLGAVFVAAPLAADGVVPHGQGLDRPPRATAAPASADPPPILATIAQTHTGERVILDERAPSQARFDVLLEDRVCGERHAIDPRLLGLLRALAQRHPGARIEIVSGYRSAKLNEERRKKGHHVARHSQHSLGHAVDFRLVPPGADKGEDPRLLRQEVRSLGWNGGVGVYTLPTDWFVHADVGPLRGWSG